jgi:hypothetical protein
MVTDVLVLAITMAVSLALKFGLQIQPVSQGPFDINYPTFAAMIAVAWLACLAAFDTRDPRIVGDGLLEYRRVVRATTLMFGALAIASVLFKWDMSRGFLAISFPLGLLGVMQAADFRSADNNIYTQIGIVLIIALASKNAILIVEFARELRLAGRSIVDAAVEASRLRFRPILMTSFAFILGVAPLVVAQGAGAAGQQALGTAVFGGMIASTVLAVFFVPSFFVVFQYLAEWFSPKSRAVVATPPEKSPPMATVAH